MSSTTSIEQGTVAAGVTDGVGTILFHHPKGNSLPGNLLQRLAEAVTALGRDPNARVIVLRSEGTGTFCAGASFDELAAIRDAESGKRFFMGFARLILAMRSAPKLIVTRVHGKVVGGGVGVVAASDYAIALDNASVKLSELAVGIGPFVVGPVIERRIGPGGLAALSVDAATFRDAAWAERRGLYARLVETEAELDAQVQRLAATLARSNPDAMARMKSIFWQGTEGWDTLLEERAGMSGRLVLSDFSRRAIEAFRSKTTPA